jgi:CubicO group peptidase (beta-lactamase class C family)
MSVPYNYDNDPYVEYFSSNDWVKASLDFIGGKDTIGTFRYAPIIGPDILSSIVVRTSGMSLLEFANTYLFKPLDIQVNKTIVFRDAKEQMAYYQSKDVEGWVSGPSGIHTAGWGLSLATSDMIKLGQLYLDNGRCNGVAIVSSSWIKESTTAHNVSEELGLSYGYLWWILDPSEQIYAAIGDGGNTIYINVKKHIVVAITSLFMENVTDHLTLIKEQIEPMLSHK